MSENKHTPGPWHKVVNLHDHERIDIPLKAINCERIGFSISFVNGHRDAEAEANARLISVAPELLDIAERLVNNGLSTSLVNDAKATIAKATGSES